MLDRDSAARLVLWVGAFIGLVIHATQWTYDLYGTPGYLFLIGAPAVVIALAGFVTTASWRRRVGFLAIVALGCVLRWQLWPVPPATGAYDFLGFPVFVVTVAAAWLLLKGRAAWTFVLLVPLAVIELLFHVNAGVGEWYWQFPYRHWDRPRWHTTYGTRITSEMYYSLDYLLAGAVGTLAAYLGRASRQLPAADDGVQGPAAVELV